MRVHRATADQWNALFLISRKIAEFQAETVQIEYFLSRLLAELGEGDSGLPASTRQQFSTAFMYAVSRWEIDARRILTVYL